MCVMCLSIEFKRHWRLALAAKPGHRDNGAYHSVSYG